MNDPIVDAVLSSETRIIETIFFPGLEALEAAWPASIRRLARIYRYHHGRASKSTVWSRVIRHTLKMHLAELLAHRRFEKQFKLARTYPKKFLGST